MKTTKILHPVTYETTHHHASRYYFGVHISAQLVSTKTTALVYCAQSGRGRRKRLLGRLGSMTDFDKIISAISQLEKYKHEPIFGIMVLNPSDLKRLHINKVSITFMRIVKRNRKDRRRRK